MHPAHRRVQADRGHFRNADESNSGLLEKTIEQVSAPDSVAEDSESQWTLGVSKCEGRMSEDLPGRKNGGCDGRGSGDEQAAASGGAG